MSITARYVDTCLSDYLQDGYNRPGQALCLASLGCSIEDTAQQLLESNQGDPWLPECFEDADIKAALIAALEGVDLRYVDEDGNPQDEPDEDRDHEEPYVYVVLEWDATVIKMRLTLDVEYLANGTDMVELKDRLENIVRNAMGEGAFTYDTDATINTWGATAEEVKGEEPGRSDSELRELISSIDRFHGNELKDRSEKSIQDEIRYLREVLGQ